MNRGAAASAGTIPEPWAGIPYGRGQEPSHGQLSQGMGRNAIYLGFKHLF